MKAQACGKTIAEYGLILALVVLVAIPGLTALGEQLQAFYQNRDPISQADRLFGLLNAGSGAGDSGAISLASADASTQAGDDARLPGSSYEGAAPTVTLNSRAIDATSVDGTTRLLSNSFRNIAQSGRLPDGTEIPDDLRVRFEELAQRGFALSDAEQEVLDTSNARADVDKKGKMKRKSVKNEVGEIIRDKSDDYGREYRALMNELEQRAQTEDIRSIREYVREHSRIITNTAKEFAKEMKLGAKESIQKDDVVGKLEKHEVIEVQLAPDVTDYSARKIERANEREQRRQQRLDAKQIQEQLKAEE